MNTYPYRTYAEIDLDQMRHNLRQVRRMIGEDCRLMFVLKADAYGHGTPVCARYSEDLVDWYAVATIDEALSIRNAGVEKPVLLFGMLMEQDIPAAVNARLTINACSLAYARRVNSILEGMGESLDCHIKIDTGMNRTGLFARVGRVDRAVAEAGEILNMSRLHTTGIYTHFSCGESSDPGDRLFTQNQYDAFSQVVQALENRGFHLGLRHCTSTCPLLCHPDWKLDMVRVGMLGYGQSMTEEAAREMDLRPILRWCAKVVAILDLEPGESVSYGRIYRTTGREKIAVLSAGYADGYNRSYSNRVRVILGGREVPQCGKICMDYTMANITGMENVQVGDDAVLLGCQDGLCIAPDQLSAAAEYGVNGWTTAQISARVPRIYLRRGEVVETRMLFH